MTTEITKVETNLPTTAMPAFDADGMSVADLVIPRVLLMQNTSEYVGDEKAKLGDMVDSESANVIGGFSTPIEFIPLKVFKTMITYDMSEGSPKFMRQEPMTAELAALRWEGTEGGIPVKRIHCINAFVVLMEDLKKGDAFPKLISFRSTSLNVGKQVATHLFKMNMLRQPPYAKVLSLKTKKEKKDTNTYAVFEFGGVVGTHDYHDQCVDFMMIIGSTKVAEDRQAKDVAEKAPKVATSLEGDMEF